MTLVVNDREQVTLSQIAPGARVAVVPNGIDIDAFRPPDPPVESPLVVFCGVMNYSPNEDGVGWFATQVWPLVRRSRPDARFAVVGSGATKAVHALAAADSSIEIVGQVPKVQPYLWRSALSIAPLRVARGLQNKVLEALAAGLPVVVTRTVLDGLPVEAQRGCLVADEPDSFAESVLRLLEKSADDRRRLAESADLARLTWTEQLRPLERILRDASIPNSR
jgi:glycosyltransferase involved in cell wall biosynthesis